MQNKACRLIYTSAQFCQNVVSLLASITMMLERAHARPNSRWANFFTKLMKTPLTGMTKNVLLSEFRWLKFDDWLNCQIGMFRQKWRSILGLQMAWWKSYRLSPADRLNLGKGHFPTYGSYFISFQPYEQVEEHYFGHSFEALAFCQTPVTCTGL